MPLITEQPSYRYGGVLYDTELQAVEAALQFVGAQLVKNHHAAMAVGLIDNRDEIMELLTTYDRLQRPATAEEVTSEKDKVVPKLTGTELDAQGHRHKCRARLTGYAKDCNCEPVGHSSLVSLPNSKTGAM